jgi:hypothetical protein
MGTTLAHTPEINALLFVLTDDISSMPLQLTVYLKTDNPQSFDTGVPG